MNALFFGKHERASLIIYPIYEYQIQASVSVYREFLKFSYISKLKIRIHASEVIAFPTAWIILDVFTTQEEDVLYGIPPQILVKVL